LPKRALETGFVFEMPRLEGAFDAILGRPLKKSTLREVPTAEAKAQAPV
jgi:hypothetical protein